MAFCITDVINSNTYLLYNEKAKTVFETIFDADPIYEGYKLNGVVSRKKQIIPLLMEELR
jgi:inorganic pyrophosphatase/exopolyphosphatase